MRFEFSTATQILFGHATLQQVPDRAASMGRKVFLLTGRQRERASGLLAALLGRGLEVLTFAVLGEPRIDLIDEAVARTREEGCDLVIGLGGGSVIDAAKAVAALHSNPGEIMAYLEVIGRGQPLSRPGLPCIAIPTTAGTGAEVTRNSVLTSAEHRVKVSLRSPWMLPRLAVVDPELTLSLPPDITAATGLDALTQLIEAYVTPAANPLTDGLCREGIRRVSRSLFRAWEQPDDRDAREDMALASLFGGLALANAKLGAVHGFAAPLGGLFDMPHGLVCARLLPLVMDANVQALRTRAPESLALARYAEVARLLSNQPQASADDGAAWVRALCAAFKVPGLAAAGLTAGAIPLVTAKAGKASSMKGNPIPLTERELTGILEKAL